MVHDQGRYHPGLRRDHQFVTGVEFLALLVPHIQHRYPCKIDTYGALSTTIRKRFGWIGRAPTPGVAGDSTPHAATALDDADTEFTRIRRRGWAQLIRKVWLDDPERCENCRGTMKIISALSAPAQDDVIRAILESTGQWDPPWNQRAPPLERVHHDAHGAPPSETTVELEYEVDYEVDPDRLWPEDGEG